MAEAWLKIEKHTPEKPEIFALADLLSIDPDQAFSKCFKFWRWADSQIVDGNAPGVTKNAIDALVGQPGFSDAMVKVGWLEFDGRLMRIPRFDSHMSQSAKNRALTAKRAASHRQKSNANSNGAIVTEALPEQEESKRRVLLHKSNRIARGTSDSEPPPVAPRLPKDAGKDTREALDLSAIDWSSVEATAETLARKVPPVTQEDRRNWLRFAVMTQLAFSQDWLSDSAEAVLNAKETRKTKQAHLYGVLKAKAVEDGLGDLFSSMLRDIDIPKQVWKSGVLGGSK